MKKINRSRIENFAELDATYAMLVRRMQHFDEQAKAGSLPKKTLTTFVKQLDSYLQIVEKEADSIEKEIEKASTYKDASIRGVLTLNKKKIELILSQLRATYTKRSVRVTKINETDKEDSLTNEHEDKAFSSIQEITTTKQLVENMKRLIDQSTSLQKKIGITIGLNDVVEEHIEREESFLLIEYDFLTNVVNMLTKIDEFQQNKKAICVGSLSRLKKTRVTSFTESNYDIKHPLFDKEQFKKEYSAYIKAGSSRLSKASKIGNIQYNIENLRSNVFLHEVITDIDKATTLLLQSNSIQDIHGGYVKLEKKHDLSYKVELSGLIAQNPFTRFNKEIILSKKSSHMITRVKHAKKLGEKYTELEHLRSELLSPFSYASNFQRTRIESIVSQYFSQVGNMQLLSYGPEETQYETFEESITNYDTYLKQEARHIKKISRGREQVQKHLNDTIRSRENVQKYTYRPFDSLEKNIPRLILLQERTGPFGSIRQELIKRLEKTYTEQYEYLIRSSGVGGSNRGRSGQASGGEIVGDFIQLLGRSGGSRRSGGRGGSFGGGGGGWSSGGGMSFGGGGRSGSGGTSW